jgi:type II secretory pathway pseudopilin PulG
MLRINKPWITLIEVMIAIIIFGTWVLVVMWTITSNIWWLYEIREKDAAIMIAKEWMDLVYHVRDSNIERNGFWNCAITDASLEDACDEFFYDDSEKYFTIWISLSWAYDINVIASTWDASTTIWYHTGALYTSATGSTLSWFWYNHDSTGGEDSWYRRWITMKPVTWYEWFTWSILEVTSQVAYSRGDRERSLILQSFIGDIR